MLEYGRLGRKISTTRCRSKTKPFVTSPISQKIAGCLILLMENKDLTTDFQNAWSEVNLVTVHVHVLAIPELAREKKKKNKDPISKDFSMRSSKAFLVEFMLQLFGQVPCTILGRLQRYSGLQQSLKYFHHTSLDP
jgi:hypothetical protein